MKLRKGFVSNSSTCSFIICGYKVADEKNNFLVVQKLLGKTKEEILVEMKACSYYKDKELSDNDIEDYCCDYLYEITFEKDGFDIEIGEGVDGIIIGKRLADISSDDSDIPNEEYELGEIQVILDVVKEKMGLSDGITPKIYMGSKCC